MTLVRDIGFVVYTECEVCGRGLSDAEALSNVDPSSVTSQQERRLSLVEDLRGASNRPYAIVARCLAPRH